MKKIIVLVLSFVMSIYSFSISNIKSETIKKDGRTDIEIVVLKFDSEKEKDARIRRDKEYLMSKEEFTYEVISDEKGNSLGVMYKGDYQTPLGYTTSWKGFYKNKYVGVSGGYEHFDEIKAIFFKEMEGIGYKYPYLGSSKTE